MNARLDFVWVDEQYSSAFNRPERDLIDSYHRTNAQIAWESHDAKWQASAYVRNLEDDDVVANLFDNSALAGLPVPIYVHYFAPRTYGVTVRRHF
jgi:outer membrane receptor protein involved in Fe transport